MLNSSNLLNMHFLNKFIHKLTHSLSLSPHLLPLLGSHKARLQISSPFMESQHLLGAIILNLLNHLNLLMLLNLLNHLMQFNLLMLHKLLKGSVQHIHLELHFLQQQHLYHKPLRQTLMPVPVMAYLKVTASLVWATAS